MAAEQSTTAAGINRNKRQNKDSVIPTLRNVEESIISELGSQMRYYLR